VTVHARDQELRFRLGEVGSFLLAEHEVRCPRQIPGALCLVEESDMLDGRAGVHKTVIAEVMHVLDESLDLTACFTELESLLLLAHPLHLVTSERFAQDGYQRSVA
jgi:hypothetical protein